MYNEYWINKNMFDELFSEYLKSVFPAEYVDMINSCREALLSFEFSLVEANLYKSVPEHSEFTTHEAKIDFERTIRDGCYELLLMLGIRTDIRRIDKLDQLLRILRNLEDSLQNESILDILMNDEYSQSETIEKLFELVSTDNTVGNMIFEIELINTNMFFKRLYDIHLQAFTSQSGEATDERPNREYFDRIQSFVAKYPQSLVARKLTNKDILFGETLQHYIAENTPELQLQYPNHPDRCPMEFAGLAIFANTPRHEMAGTIKTAITKFYSDLKFTAKTNYLVDKFVEEIEYEHQPASLVQAGN